MRIEGTHTFPAPIDSVFAILTDPDRLQHAIPGCERLIQLGPPEADGATALEARLRTGPGANVYALHMNLGSVRRPAHLRLEVAGRGPQGAICARGRIDLVAQEQQTVGAYVWDIEGDPTGERRTLGEDAGRRFARAVCQHIAEQLRVEQGSPNGRHAVEGTVARTPHGQIVILPRASVALLPEQPVLRRVAWMTAGLAVGLAAIGLAIQLVRRLEADGRG
jgi:carbon monoxide dehydrogenase subunit G